MKREEYHQLIKPELINTVSGLSLIARVIVDGYLSGIHHSNSVGSGMEFNQYRTYEPGDDLRLLDWKMLARSGRYYVKQSEIETNISVKFILDASKSMLHQENGMSKMDFARVLIASLGYLSKNQGDAVGLFALNDQKFFSMYPKVQKQYFNRLLQGLIDIENKGKWPKNPDATKQLHDRSHKELILFITDFYEHQDEITSFIKKLKSPRNEVVVLHVMGKNELEFDYDGTVTFEDLETGSRYQVDTKIAKKEYLLALEQMMKKVKNSLLANDIGYHLFKLDDHIGEAIQFFLKKRNKLV